MISTPNTPPVPLQIDSWQKAETNAAEWMRFWGYEDARCTGSGPDGGVDISSRRALGQVKFEASAVGTPALQRLVGARAHSHHKSFFFSGAGYASKAREYAETMDIALFKYDLLGQMTAHSSAARSVLADAKAAAARASSSSDEPSALLTPRTVDYGKKGHPAATSAQAGRGWFGRNWTLLVAVYFAYALARNLIRLISSPTGGDWFNVIFSVAGAAVFAVVWIRVKAKRVRWREERRHGVDPATSTDGLWTRTHPVPSGPISATDTTTTRPPTSAGH